MLLNYNRSIKIMEKYKLDGLVAREHINIHYLTDYWDTQADGKWPYLVYGLLPKDNKIDASLILPSVKLERLSLWPTWVKNIVPYSDYSGRETSTSLQFSPDEPKASRWDGWPIRKNAKLTDLEKKWISLSENYKNKMAATSTWGLFRAIKESKLENKRIGCDDPRVLTWLKQMGLHDLEIVDATNIFREIRIVKSKNEINILKQAAIINEKACLEASSNLKIGDSWEKVEKNYHISMSKQNGRNGHIITSLGGLPNNKIELEKPFLVDALGEYKNYFGDFGRTIVLGEASRELRKRAKCLMLGLEKASEIIKPGIRKSTIISEVIDTVRKAGFPEFFYVSPHSIGLEHTDQPLPLGPETHGKNTDFTIERDMVLNIDMPYFEWGWGTMHLEDTFLVKDNNVEILTSMSSPLIEN